MILDQAITYRDILYFGGVAIAAGIFMIIIIVLRERPRGGV